MMLVVIAVSGSTHRAAIAISELRDAINETTALAVWTATGPVVVRWERPRRPITVNVLTGTTLGVLTSTAGRVFGAWLPEAQTQALIEQEIQAGKAPAGIDSLEAAHALLASVKADGFATIEREHVLHGIEAAAAPVFNFKNEISMALLLVGVEGSIDMSPQSKAIIALRDATRALSVRLGATIFD